MNVALAGGKLPPECGLNYNSTRNYQPQRQSPKPSREGKSFLVECPIENEKAHEI
jgi:hypothetical protein